MTTAVKRAKAPTLDTRCVLALDRALARAEKHFRNQKFASADLALEQAALQLQSLRVIALSEYGATRRKRELNRLVLFYGLWHAALRDTVAAVNSSSEAACTLLDWQYKMAVGIAKLNPHNRAYKRLVQKIKRWRESIQQPLSQVS